MVSVLPFGRSISAAANEGAFRSITALPRVVRINPQHETDQRIDDSAPRSSLLLMRTGESEIPDRRRSTICCVTQGCPV